MPNGKLNPGAAPFVPGSKLDPGAKPFVPKTADAPQGITVYKSTRYVGDAAHYEDIKRLFLTLSWPPTVRCVYVTNGWHEGFENGRMVTYCGYAPDVDLDTAKLHYYR